MSKRTLLASAAAIAAVGIAGGAIAATKLTSPKDENQAIIDDAAGQLGIDPSRLGAALKKALENQIDQAVAAGRLPKEVGDELKASIEADEVPLFAGPGFPFGKHGFGLGVFPGPFAEDLSTAATYLGMTEADLQAALRGGKSLADVAKDKGKSVDGLIDALVAVAEKKWDEAVASGKIKDHTTAADKREFLAGVRDRVTHLVNDRFPPLFAAPVVPFAPRWFGFRGFHGPGLFSRDLSTAATYLGVTQADLRKALEGGKSLADVAKDNGKSVDGLIDALVAVAEKKWDAAVASGKIKDHTTAADKREFLAGVRDRVTHLVNNRFPPRPDWHDFGRGFWPPLHR